LTHHHTDLNLLVTSSDTAPDGLCSSCRVVQYNNSIFNQSLCLPSHVKTLWPCLMMDFNSHKHRSSPLTTLDICKRKEQMQNPAFWGFFVDVSTNIIYMVTKLLLQEHIVWSKMTSVFLTSAYCCLSCVSVLLFH